MVRNTGPVLRTAFSHTHEWSLNEFLINNIELFYLIGRNWRVAFLGLVWMWWEPLVNLVNIYNIDSIYLILNRIEWSFGSRWEDECSSSDLYTHTHGPDGKLLQSDDRAVHSLVSYLSNSKWKITTNKQIELCSIKTNFLYQSAIACVCGDLF